MATVLSDIYRFVFTNVAPAGFDSLVEALLHNWHPIIPKPHPDFNYFSADFRTSLASWRVLSFAHCCALFRISFRLSRCLASASAPSDLNGASGQSQSSVRKDGRPGIADGQWFGHERTPDFEQLLVPFIPAVGVFTDDDEFRPCGDEVPVVAGDCKTGEWTPVVNSHGTIKG